MTTSGVIPTAWSTSWSTWPRRSKASCKRRADGSSALVGTSSGGFVHFGNPHHFFFLPLDWGGGRYYGCRQFFCPFRCRSIPYFRRLLRFSCRPQPPLGLQAG